MNIRGAPKKVVLFLLIIFVILLCGNLTTIYLRYGMGIDYLKGFITMFDFDKEQNVSTWYASFLLLLSSLFFAVISLAKMKNNDRYRYHWVFLSCLFAFISVDETACIHEKIGVMLGQFLSFKGYPCYAWVFPAMFILMVMGAFYVKFYFDLPKVTKRMFSLAAGVYVGGGLVMEMVGGRYSHVFGDNNAGFALLATVEESMEFVGIIILIYALIVYVKEHIGKVEIEIND